jgi:hypothetical protein
MLQNAYNVYNARYNLLFNPNTPAYLLNRQCIYINTSDDMTALEEEAYLKFFIMDMHIDWIHSLLNILQNYVLNMCIRVTPSMKSSQDIIHVSS